MIDFINKYNTMIVVILLIITSTMFMTSLFHAMLRIKRTDRLYREYLKDMRDRLMLESEKNKIEDILK